MLSKKWYFKMNISCDAHHLNELLETDVPWDDAIVVSAGKLRKLWDSLSEMRSSLCERRLEMTALRPALSLVKNCAVYSVFPSGMMSHSKIAQFNWVCIGRFNALNSFTFVDYISPVGVAVPWRQNASVVAFCAEADVNAVFTLSCHCHSHQIHSHIAPVRLCLFTTLAIWFYHHIHRAGKRKFWG